MIFHQKYSFNVQPLSKFVSIINSWSRDQSLWRSAWSHLWARDPITSCWWSQLIVWKLLLMDSSLGSISFKIHLSIVPDKVHLLSSYMTSSFLDVCRRFSEWKSRRFDPDASRRRSEKNKRRWKKWFICIHQVNVFIFWSSSFDLYHLSVALQSFNLLHQLGILLWMISSTSLISNILNFHLLISSLHLFFHVFLFLKHPAVNSHFIY